MDIIEGLQKGEDKNEAKEKLVQRESNTTGTPVEDKLICSSAMLSHSISSKYQCEKCLTICIAQKYSAQIMERSSSSCSAIPVTNRW